MQFSRENFIRFLIEIGDDVADISNRDCCILNEFATICAGFKTCMTTCSVYKANDFSRKIYYEPWINQFDQYLDSVLKSVPKESKEWSNRVMIRASRLVVDAETGKW